MVQKPLLFCRSGARYLLHPIIGLCLVTTTEEASKHQSKSRSQLGEIATQCLTKDCHDLGYAQQLQRTTGRDRRRSLKGSAQQLLQCS